MSLLRDLKKNRASFMEKLKTEAAKMNTNGNNSNQADERFWQPTKDKVGNAVAVIRFLPNINVEELPWVRTYSHGFQNKTNGSWYIEECPTTINQKCPVCEANSVLWNTGIEKNKNIVRDRKRRLHYISNILVVSDSAAPENEGKVKLFRYGKKIFDKINSAMFPEFEDLKPLNPFDPWEGANFKLRVRKFEGYTNYDKSEFAEVSALSEDDAEIENIIKQSYSLAEFIDAKNFKNYDELKAKLNKVLAEESVPTSVESDEESDPDEEGSEDIAKFMGFKTEKPEEQVEKPAAKVQPVVAKKQTSGDDDDEIESYLKGLAEDND